jgi:hypothetical protein
MAVRTTPDRPRPLPRSPAVGGWRTRVPQAKATTAAEKAFLGLGTGAHAWLIEAAAAGAQRRSVLPDSVGPVFVDEMSATEATSLLTRGLDHVPALVVERLLRLTGRWPVLLGLVNGAARAGGCTSAEDATWLTTGPVRPRKSPRSGPALC